KVWLPSGPNALFDSYCKSEWIKDSLLAGAKISAGAVDGRAIVCLNWRDLQDRPLMKDDFAQFFGETKPVWVLLDAVRFVPGVTVEHVDLAFLGRLARFVNFVDAVHDCNQALLVRGNQPGSVGNQDLSQYFQETLSAYDERLGGNYGRSAWIEW